MSRAATASAPAPIRASRRGVEVRDAEGRFLFHATIEQADAALAAGVAAPVGRGTVKYLRLDRVSAATRINTGDFTRRPRNEVHETIGGPWLREHKRLTGEETPKDVAG